MKTRVVIIIAALLSFTVLLFGVMYDLTYIDDKEFRTDSMNPRISSFEENTYVVWGEAKDSEFFDVYLRKITGGSLLDEPLNLTQGKSFYPRPQVLASENNVYVLWEDRTSGHDDRGDSTYIKKSTDYGQTFGETAMLGSSDVNSISHTPITLMESGGILYVFMSQWNPQTDETIIVFRPSHDGGDTFGKPVTFFEFGKKNALLLDILAVNDTVYAASGSYYGYDESGEVHFRKIHPDGNLSDVVNLSKTGHLVNDLDVSVDKDSNDIHVISTELVNERNPDSGLVLEKRSLFFTKSQDGGNTFGKPVQINTDWNFGGVEIQSMQVISYHDDNVYMMWNEVYFDKRNGFHNTLYARSTDGGDAFDVTTHPLDELRSEYGKIYAYEKNDALYFIIVSKTQSFFEDGTIYFAKSDDGGTTISKVINVTGNLLTLANEPKVSIHGNDIQIIVDVMHDKNCILHISSDDDGESFAEPVNLSPNGSLEDCFAK